MQPQLEHALHGHLSQEGVHLFEPGIRRKRVESREVVPYRGLELTEHLTRLERIEPCPDALHLLLGHRRVTVKPVDQRTQEDARPEARCETTW